MQFDQDTIKELAVHAVQRFVSDKTPLDESIAERARALQLNEEQVRRVVEATNTIAFLKLRDGAEDKTFEFKVASFQGVMNALIGAPASSDYVAVDDDPVEDSSTFEKKASEEYQLEISDDQKHILLNRHLHHVRGELQKIAVDLYGVSESLERNVHSLTKQAYWQERLSVVASEDEFSRIMRAFGESGFDKQASLEDRVFVGKELEVANNVVSLVKQAAEFSIRKAELETMEKRAWAALASLVGRGLRGMLSTPKVAGAMKGAKAAASASGLPKDSLKVAKSVAKDPLSMAAHGASKAMGVASTVATAPLGAAVGLGIRTAGAAVKRVKKTSIGAMGIAGMALSSATYQPKINQRTGRPNDVWSNIYD